MKVVTINSGCEIDDHFTQSFQSFVYKYFLKVLKAKFGENSLLRLSNQTFFESKRTAFYLKTCDTQVPFFSPNAQTLGSPFINRMRYLFLNFRWLHFNIRLIEKSG
jgi:hypothetical protein